MINHHYAAVSQSKAFTSATERPERRTTDPSLSSPGLLPSQRRPVRHEPCGSSIKLLRVFVVLVGLLPIVALGAEEAPVMREPVIVGLYTGPPFVMDQGGHFTGMAVQLWETLAAGLHLQTTYRVFPTVGQLVRAVTDGEVDVAVTALTITQRRARRFDFTQPWFDAGLRIMVDRDRTPNLRDLIAGLRSSGYLRTYAALALVVIVATILLTLFHRRFDKDFPRRWRDGLAESFYNAMSVATSGRAPGRKPLFGWVGRILSALWLVFGVAVFAYVTSSMASVMTTLSLTDQINGLADLHGRTVGVFTGSVAEEFTRESSLTTRSFPDIQAAVAALLAGRIAAIVGDSPVLEYYERTHPSVPLTVVGDAFDPRKYGFGLPHGSALTRPLTIELLGAQESGVVRALRVQYFGEGR